MSWIKKLLLGIFSLGIVALLTLPWWLIWTLPYVNESLGLKFSSIDRRGYTYIVFSELQGVYPDFSFEAKRLEIPNPLFWASQALIGYPKVQARGTDIIINIKEKDNATLEDLEQSKTTGDVYKITQKIIQIWEGYIRFIPPTYLTGVTINAKDNTFVLDTADWEDHTLYTEGEWTTKEEKFSINVGMKPNEKSIIEATFPGLDLTVQSEVKLRGRGVEATGDFQWENNNINVQGIWNQTSDIPDNLIVRSQDYTLKPNLLNLTSHEELISNILLEWTPDGYKAALTSYAKGKENATPIDIELDFEGHGKSLDIKKLKLLSPWINNQGESVEENSLKFVLNLFEFVNIPIDGSIEGEVQITNSEEKYPEIATSLKGDKLFFFQKETGQLELKATLKWPTLTIEKLHLETTEGSKLDFSTEVDFKTNDFIKSDYTLTLTPTFINNLSDGLQAQSIHAEGFIEGSLNDWPKEASLKGTLTAAGLTAGIADIGNLKMDWKGTLWETEINISGSNDRGDWALNGNLDWRSKNCFLKIKESFFNSTNFGKLSLKETSEACASADETSPLLEIDPLVFYVEEKPELNLSALLTDSKTGEFELDIQAHAFSILKALFVSPAEIKHVTFNSLNIKGNVKDSYVYSNSKLVGTYTNEKQSGYTLEATANTDENRWTLNISAKEKESQREDLSLKLSTAINDESWKNLIKDKKLPKWADIEGNLEANSIPLELLRPFIPELLKDEGTLGLKAQKERGKELSGSATLASVESMPIPTIGVIQNISSNITFKEDQAIIETFSGEFGGVPLTITGNVDYKNFQDLFWDLKITGNNLPITRSAGIRLRGDIDISFTSQEKDDALIAGTITLKEGLALGDLATILSSNSSPNSTPPYFKIEQAPFSNWRINVKVEGDKFLRVQSPFLRTKVSSDLKLGGKLGEPTIDGRVWADNGVISFPFASFKVAKAEVNVSEGDPEPEISINASAKTYGYTIKLEGSGSLDDPIIEFSSTPSLDSQEILLMVSIGQIPSTAGNQNAKEASPIAGLGLYLGKSLFGDLGFFDSEENRLRVSVGEDIAESGKNTADIEYEITDKVTLRGEFDRYEAFNLDAKWEIYSK